MTLPLIIRWGGSGLFALLIYNKINSFQILPLSHFYVFKVRVFSFSLMKANKKRCVSMVHNGNFYILYKKLKQFKSFIFFIISLLVVRYKLLLILLVKIFTRMNLEKFIACNSRSWKKCLTGNICCRVQWYKIAKNFM